MARRIVGQFTKADLESVIRKARLDKVESQEEAKVFFSQLSKKERCAFTAIALTTAENLDTLTKGLDISRLLKYREILIWKYDDGRMALEMKHPVVPP